jgi:hypothetical protein
LCTAECGDAPGDGQNACAALTNERHGNSILKNGQHLFTMLSLRKIAEKIAEKLWNGGEIVCFVTLNSGDKDDNLSENTGV